MKNINIWIAALALSLSLVSVQSLAADAPAKQIKQAAKIEKEKVIIQVSDADPAKWNLALNNAKNVQQAIGSD